MTVIELLNACMNVRNHTTVTIENVSEILYYGKFDRLLRCYDLYDNLVITFELTGEGMRIVTL